MAKITEIKNEKNGNYVWIDPWFCEVISRCIYETMNNKGLSNYTNLIISKFYNFIESTSLGECGLGIDGVGLYFEKEVLEDATSKSQLIQILKDSKVHIDTFGTEISPNQLEQYEAQKYYTNQAITWGQGVNTSSLKNLVDIMLQILDDDKEFKLQNEDISFVGWEGNRIGSMYI